MAAIYSGIHLKLKSSSTPWPDKIKLARFAWISTQCLLPNKEQVLFDWTSHALTCFYQQKIELPSEVVEELWAYFDEILHSRKLHNFLSKKKTINLHSTVPQLINDRILDYCSGRSASFLTVLSCCHGILSTPVLSVTYTAKYEMLVQLLSRLCCLTNGQLREHNDEPLTLKVFELLLLVLNTYLTVQKQQGNSNKVFIQVKSHLLRPLLLLRHLLNTRVWTEKDDVKIQQNLSKEIRTKVDALLLSALFVADHFQSYKREVLPKEGEIGHKKSRFVKGMQSPLNMILSKLSLKGANEEEETLFYAVKSNSLGLLFTFALDSFCKGTENAQVIFYLMAKLITALGFTDELGLDVKFRESNWGLALLTVENLLKSCLAGEIYNVAADRIQHGEVQLNFYRKLARLLLCNAQVGFPAWYHCLKALLALNHYILEPDLDKVLSAVWVYADNMELHVRKAREDLVSTIVQTYVKLRQLPKLIECLLDVVCQPAAHELTSVLLPEPIHKTLRECLLDNPLSQSLEIGWLIFKRIQGCLVSHNQDERSDLLQKVFPLCLLLNNVLFSFKSLDNSTPVPTVKQTQKLMREILDVIEDLMGQKAAGSCSEKNQEVILALTYTWVEVDALFQIHCDKYTVQIVSERDSLVDKALAVGNLDSPLGKLLQNLLMLHKLKSLLLKSSTAPADVTSIQNIARFIFRSQKPSKINCGSKMWDFQYFNVDASTYNVAQWFLVTSNLPLIAPYLERDDMSAFAEYMLQSLLKSSDESENGLNNTEISVALISRQLVESSVFCEVPEVFSALTQCIIRALHGLCDPSQMLLISPSILTPIENMVLITDEKTGVMTSIKRLTVIGQEMLESIKMKIFPLSLSETEVDRILQLVKVAHFLNGCAMSQEDYLELFLSLFALTAFFQCDANVKLSTSVGLFRELLSLMASLLQVENCQMILNIVHGSDLLEAVMTCLFSHCKRGLFEGLDAQSWFCLLESIQELIQSLVLLIVDRWNSARINLEKCTSFMVENVFGAETNNFYSIQLYLVTLGTLCKEMISIINRNKKLDQTLICLLEKTTSVMEPAIQTVLKGLGTSPLKQSLSVEVVTVMIKSDLARASRFEAEEKMKIPRMTFYRSFYQQILMEICPSPRPMDFLISSLHYLSAFYSAAELSEAEDLDELHIEIMQSINALLSGSWISLNDVKELEGPVKELLSQLMSNCSEKQFHLFLVMLREGLVAQKVEGGLFTEVLSTVTLIKLLTSCCLPNHCSKAFWLFTPQILSNIIFIIKESSKLSSLTFVITLPALEAVTTLIRKGEAQLTNPHHVIVLLDALQFVPLDSQSMDNYLAAFGAIHEALCAIIFHYPQVMLKASPVFLNGFYRLVSSLMYEGRQRYDTTLVSEKNIECLVKCARLVERMYTHIASNPEHFSSQSSFMVAQYVSELQRVTLHPEVKAHLTEGIYCVMDLCGEHNVKFLSTTLQAGVKEVYSELYSSYIHHHRSQRQGEEKYTFQQ